MCRAQSKVSVDWLEITRSDLHSEICIAQKMDDYAKGEGGEYTRHCMSAFLHGSDTESRMKIDQT